MKVKQFDNRFDVLLWALFIILLFPCWKLADKITAPKYERNNKDITIEYSFTKDDGSHVNSKYELIWGHEGYSPRLKFRDFQYDRTADVADQYLNEYLATAAPSAYPHWWQHIFWWMFGGLAVIDALTICFAGQWIRDQLLYRKIVKNPQFVDCTYYLYHVRFAHVDDVKRLLPLGASKYIESKIPELQKKYSQDLVSLVYRTLCTVVAQKSTQIKYYLSFKNSLKNQNDFLEDIQKYWYSRRGADPKAQQYIDDLEKYKKERFEPFPQFSENEFHENVTRELDEIFKKVMDSELFKFEAYKHPFATALKIPGIIFVDVTLMNSESSFTWSGDKAVDKFAGIRVKFSIYIFRNKEKVILWEKILPPSCNYTSTDEDFKPEHLYRNMVITTIDTLSSKI